MLPDFKTISTELWQGCQIYAPIAFILQEISLVLIFIDARYWWRSWLRHRATSPKVAGSIPDGVIGNS